MRSAMESGRPAASAELASLASGRASLADRAVQPWWYDTALGLVVFALLGALSARSTVLQLVVDAVALVALVGLKGAHTRHTGRLEEAGYVRVRKAPVASRTRTSLALTRAGREAFDAHVAELRRIAGV